MDRTYVPNSAGITELANSGPMQKLLLDEAEKIAGEAQARATYAGAAYRCDVQAGARRAHGRVSTANDAAYWDEMVGGAPLASSF